ncbi:hypothetical protein BX600DRAFT_96793 [Xylariales sp. PMI_506]|nr:hypothetical protein BX600DRAFT_96793 [Xylariales sp. PMI_506]
MLSLLCCVVLILHAPMTPLTLEQSWPILKLERGRKNRIEVTYTRKTWPISECARDKVSKEKKKVSKIDCGTQLNHSYQVMDPFPMWDISMVYDQVGLVHKNVIWHPDSCSVISFVAHVPSSRVSVARHACLSTVLAMVKSCIVTTESPDDETVRY